jgi:hypothetical protein
MLEVVPFGAKMNYGHHIEINLKPMRCAATRADDMLIAKEISSLVGVIVGVIEENWRSGGEMVETSDSDNHLPPSNRGNGRN